MPEFYGWTYEVKRSNRKSVSLSVRQDGSLLVRAPAWLPESEILRFLQDKREWIRKTAERMKKAAERINTEKAFTEEELKEMARQAAAVIPERVAYYARKLGVTA